VAGVADAGAARGAGGVVGATWGATEVVGDQRGNLPHKKQLVER
jgi:hypothetical protein